jgi:hypothetical protein
LYTLCLLGVPYAVFFNKFALIKKKKVGGRAQENLGQIALYMNNVEDKDPSLAILDAFEDDFLREVKVACPKT